MGSEMCIRDRKFHRRRGVLRLGRTTLHPLGFLGGRQHSRFQLGLSRFNAEFKSSDKTGDRIDGDFSLNNCDDVTGVCSHQQ